MGKKQKLTLSVDEELVKKGRELGFNFSKLLERTLKEEIRLHEGSYQPNGGNLTRETLVQRDKWTGRDLNPRPRRCQRRDHSRLIYPPKLLRNKKTIKFIAECAGALGVALRLSSIAEIFAYEKD